MDKMKTYIIRAEKKLIGYYVIEAKSLEQMSVRPTTAIETATCDEIILPKESMVISESHQELTNKEKKDG